MKREKRWMKSAIETSKGEMPLLPWARKIKATPAKRRAA